MARSFHRKRSLEANSELNVTALIDLGFALLIIFMISTPLIEKEQVMEVDLPTSKSGGAESSTETMNIVVSKNGFLLDGDLMSELQLDQELEMIAAGGKAPVFSIRANADTPYQNWVTVMDLLMQHKLNKVGFVTRPEK